MTSITQRLHVEEWPQEVGRLEALLEFLLESVQSVLDKEDVLPQVRQMQLQHAVDVVIRRVSL